MSDINVYKSDLSQCVSDYYISINKNRVFPRAQKKHVALSSSLFRGRSAKSTEV